MNNRTLPLGIAIIAAGIIIMLGKLGVFAAIGAGLWPLLLLAAGVLLYIGVINGKLPAIVYVPGLLLIGCGAAFLLSAWFGWFLMKALWPLIPASVAAGLFLFAAEERLSLLRTVALGIGGISLVLLVITLFLFVHWFLVTMLLIVTGVVMIARRPNFR